MAIITKTEDGFAVVHDGGVDQVHVSHDPAQAAQNRKYLNQLLARYGYALREEEAMSAPTIAL